MINAFEFALTLHLVASKLPSVLGRYALGDRLSLTSTMKMLLIFLTLIPLVHLRNSLFPSVVAYAYMGSIASSGYFWLL